MMVLGLISYPTETYIASLAGASSFHSASSSVCLLADVLVKTHTAQLAVWVFSVFPRLHVFNFTV